MYLYYRIGEDIHGPAAQLFAEPGAPEAVAEGIEGIIASASKQTIPKTRITTARKHERVLELRKAEKISQSPEDRNKATREIRKELKPRPVAIFQPGRIQARRKCIKIYWDLNDGMIGSLYVLPHLSKFSSYQLIGDMRFLADSYFNFEKTKLGEYCTRTTVLLTEEGRQYVNAYLRRSMKPQVKTINYGKGSFRRKISKAETKNKANRRCHEIDIDGVNVHINQAVPKIEIYTRLGAGLDSLLCGADGLTQRQEKMVYDYSYCSRTKVWVMHTTPEMNAFVFATFSTLSNVVNAIYSRYTQQ